MRIGPSKLVPAWIVAALLAVGALFLGGCYVEFGHPHHHHHDCD